MEKNLGKCEMETRGWREEWRGWKNEVEKKLVEVVEEVKGRKGQGK